MTKGWSAAAPTAWGCSLPFATRRRSLSPSPLPLPPPLPPSNGALGSVPSSPCVTEGSRCSAAPSRLRSSGSGRRNSLVLLLGSSLGFSALPTTLLISPSLAAEGEEAGREEPLERYTDKEVGFTLLRPSSWVKVDKAGATVLFVGESNKGNTIGVVVNPVRLASLVDFGTPQFVAERLIQAERRKESTKDAQMLRIAERTGHGGLPIYEYEYTVDSTRGGLKRIFSAAFVDAKKLFLLNIAHSDNSESPLDNKTRTILEKVLHSFDAV